jgi:hypothetical protein
MEPNQGGSAKKSTTTKEMEDLMGDMYRTAWFVAAASITLVLACSPSRKSLTVEQAIQGHWAREGSGTHVYFCQAGADASMIKQIMLKANGKQETCTFKICDADNDTGEFYCCCAEDGSPFARFIFSPDKKLLTITEMEDLAGAAVKMAAATEPGNFTFVDDSTGP